MGELGELLGWITGVCFIAAVLNYFVKRVNKRWIAPLPKESSVKTIYQKLMKLVVKYHRYFGLAAAAAVAAHLPVQVLGQFASVSGIAAASLLVLTAVMGAVMLYGHKGKLIKAHRVVAFAGFAAFLAHLIIKL